MGFLLPLHDFPWEENSSLMNEVAEMLFGVEFGDLATTFVTVFLGQSILQLDFTSDESSFLTRFIIWKVEF